MSDDQESPAIPDTPILGPYSDSLPFILMRAREAIMMRLRPLLTDHGVTEQQWRVLRTLAGVEEEEVTRLAELTFLHAPSLSRIVRDLTARKLVRRRRPQADLRRGLVSITSEGLALIDALSPTLAVANAEIGERCSAARLSALKSILIEIEQELSPSDPIQGPGARLSPTSSAS